MITEDTMAVLKRLCRGNGEAFEFVMMFIEIADTWDNLIDKDVSVSDTSINRAFVHAILGFNRNKFFRANIDELLPLIEIGIINWLASNVLEKSSDVEQKIDAHFMRHSIGDVLTHVARLIGGLDWAVEMAPDVVRIRRADSLAHFIEESKRHEMDR